MYFEIHFLEIVNDISIFEKEYIMIFDSYNKNSNINN